jgi:hypothetical protein
VGLFIANHLQDVFGSAQDEIGFTQLLDDRRRQQLGARQQRQHLEQRRILQAPVASAAHQLKGLHDEFDLAYPATSEFEVLLEIAARDLARDQRLHVAQRFEHAEIQIAPVDERSDVVAVGGRVGFDSHDRPRLDPCVSLPISAVLLQVVLERREAEDQGAAFAEWPQAHVDSKYEAVLGSGIEQCDELPAEALKVLQVVDAAGPAARARLGEQQDEIDVGRKIEFVTAELAHAQNDQGHGLSGRRSRRAKYGLEQLLRKPRGGSDAGIGEIRERPQRLGAARPADEVAPSDAQHLPPPPDSQTRLGIGLALCGERQALVFAPGGNQGHGIVVQREPRQGRRVPQQGRRDEFAAGDYLRQLLEQLRGQRRPHLLPGVRFR